MPLVPPIDAKIKTVGFIYGLFDSRQSLELINCRYVGQTTIPIDDRLDQHIYKSATSDSRRYVYNWMRKLKREGIDPTAILIEEIVWDDEAVLFNLLDDAERNWIKIGHQLDWRLTNVTDGGHGVRGYKFTDDQLKQLSAAVIQAHIDDPGIAERKRQGQIRRYEDPDERRKSADRLRTTIEAMSQTQEWCPDCGRGPFIGEWGLTAHLNNDHDPQPTHCSDCDDGPFVGDVGLARHRSHRHFSDGRKDPLICDCGEGPFAGLHGLNIHQARYCPVRNANGRSDLSVHLTAVYADNTELRQLIGDRVKEARDNEDKTLTMCDCGKGPFKGPRAIKLHQTKSGCGGIS